MFSFRQEGNLASCVSEEEEEVRTHVCVCRIHTHKTDMCIPFLWC